MTPFDIFLWGVAPYISFTILILGTIIRRVFFARTWTSKSSEFLEKKNEKFANPIFHIAIAFVFFGHVGGVLIPQSVTEMLGVNEHMYHLAAFGMGGAAGVLLAIGVILLVRRRFGSNKRMRANTSRMDRVLYVVLVCTILAGLGATFANADGGFNYRESLSPWFRDLFILQPNPELMMNIPVLFKVHMCCWMVLFALLPFTRLVHVFSGVTAPFRYVARKTILYRRRKGLRRGAECSLEYPEGIPAGRR